MAPRSKPVSGKRAFGDPTVGDPVVGKPLLCLYCGFQWTLPSMLSDHLEERHPYVNLVEVLSQAVSTRRLCMYCDVEWNLTYQYKDHLKEHHTNIDPDAVLGEGPGYQCNDKIIARFYY